MKFPNAAKGVKKIFAAEILTLISSVCMIVGLILAFPTIGSKDETGQLLGAGSLLIFMLAAGVLAFIAFIMNIVGIAQAKNDEPVFRNALFFIIFGIACTITSYSLMNVDLVLSSVFSTAARVIDVFVTVFVIGGIVRIADRLNRGDISAKGTNVLKIMIAVYALNIIGNIIALIMGGQTASIAAAIITLIALVLAAIQFILYLSFLSQAKKMLAEQK